MLPGLRDSHIHLANFGDKLLERLTSPQPTQPVPVSSPTLGATVDEKKLESLTQIGGPLPTHAAPVPEKVKGARRDVP